MVILVRYAEIGIKGRNRERFERVLVQNIELCLKRHNIPHSVRRLFGRILIETGNHCAALRRVFGIASFSRAVPAGKTIDDAFAATKKQVEQLAETDSFRVTCRRSDKNFPLTSQEVCVRLGAKLGAVTKAKVKMQNPTVNIELEIIGNTIYVLADRTEGPGGMPVGSQGSVLALIENDASVLAALLVMKRGCTVVPVVLQDAGLSLLEAFAPSPLAPEKSRDVDALLAKHKARAAVVNDTLDNQRQVSLNALLLRPLSGMNAEDVQNERKQFDRMLDSD
jgi:thiamine biosynthesis protein ThiI